MSYLERAKRAAFGHAMADVATSLSPGPTLHAAAPEFPRAVSRLLAMPLEQFETLGSPLEVRVPWYAETLWFVPCETDAAALGREGVSRGRIWTAGELASLFATPTPDSVRLVALTKLEFSGDIIAVDPRQRVAEKGVIDAS